MAIYYYIDPYRKKISKEFCEEGVPMDLLSMKLIIMDNGGVHLYFQDITTEPLIDIHPPNYPPPFKIGFGHAYILGDIVHKGGNEYDWHHADPTWSEETIKEMIKFPYNPFCEFE